MTTQLRRAALALLLSLAVPAHAQVQSNMIVQIEANGEVITTGEGGSPLGGIDTTDYAFVLNYAWTGEASLDPSSGLPTGRQKFNPLRLVKPLARSSVLLRQALDQSQSVDLELRLFAPDGAGSTEEIYRIDLANGRVVGIRPFTDGATGQYLEEVQFAWQSLEFTDVQTATSHVIQFTTQP